MIRRRIAMFAIVPALSVLAALINTHVALYVYLQLMAPVTSTSI